jgi:DivIVA domain-containing protein
MDPKQIDRLRHPGFTIARRGYDRREVDNFLGSLVDWLESDAPEEIGDVAVKHKLDLVGRATSRILQTTEEESAQLRRRVEEQCEELREDAEAAALSTRQAADDYAERTRAKADDEARQTEQAAEAKAAGIVAEGERRRAEIERVIGELEVRREVSVQDLQRLRDEITATIEAHRSGAVPASPPVAVQEAPAVAER